MCCPNGAVFYAIEIMLLLPYFDGFGKPLVEQEQNFGEESVLSDILQSWALHS